MMRPFTTMRYQGQIYRPPSEARSYILQATIGCSWNHCTYCDMYRAKDFRVRDLDETLADIRAAGVAFGRDVEKVFVADGDALVMDVAHWEAILSACRDAFPRLRRVSAYATAMNLGEKTPEALARLRELGLDLLYIGPETGDDVTFKRIAKGAGFQEHVEAARRARAAGMQLSAIFLLGAGGTARSQEHAEASARLITEMDPAFVSLLTLTVIPGTPMAKLQAQGKLELPAVARMLEELRTIVVLAERAQRRGLPHQPRAELPAAVRPAARRSRAHPGRGGSRHGAAARVGAGAVSSLLMQRISLQPWQAGVRAHVGLDLRASGTPAALPDSCPIGGAPAAPFLFLYNR